MAMSTQIRNYLSKVLEYTYGTSLRCSKTQQPYNRSKNRRTIFPERVRVVLGQIPTPRNCAI